MRLMNNIAMGISRSRRKIMKEDSYDYDRRSPQPCIEEQSVPSPLSESRDIRTNKSEREMNENETRMAMTTASSKRTRWGRQKTSKTLQLSTNTFSDETILRNDTRHGSDTALSVKVDIKKSPHQDQYLNVPVSLDHEIQETSLHDSSSSKKPFTSSRHHEKKNLIPLRPEISADLMKYKSKEESHTLSRITLRRIHILRSSHGLPLGLAHQVALTIEKRPLRIWILDNSGSMGTGDGRRFVSRTHQMVNCSRWEELRDAVLFMAELSRDMGAPTIFRFMNENSGSGKQVAGICARKVKKEEKLWGSGWLNGWKGAKQSSSNIKERECWQGIWEVDPMADDDCWYDEAQKDLEELRDVILKTEPRYKTPLSAHLWAVHDQVKVISHTLLEADQMAVVVIASDGLPSDLDEFLNVMNHMQKLPIHIIIRLCTDDDAALEFWKTLDLDLDISIDVLDDFEAVAEEVYDMNPFINYCLPLQRARGWGYKNKLLDVLRERQLTHDELREFCALLFGLSVSTLPHPKEDWETFYSDLEALQAREFKHWNLIKKGNKSWIDIREMADIYGGRAEKIRKTRQKKLTRKKKFGYRP